MKITTTRIGFEFNGVKYRFTKEKRTEIVSDSQLFAFTDKGIILLDKSCTIDGVLHDDIESFAKKLVNQ